MQYIFSLTIFYNKVIFFLALLAVVIASSCNPSKPQSLVVRPQFVFDKPYYYEIQKTKITSESDALKNIRTSTELSVTISKVSSTEHQYLWRYNKTVLKGALAVSMDTKFEKQIDYLNGLTLTFKTDNNGNSPVLLNFDSLVSQIKTRLSFVYVNNIPGTSQQDIAEVFQLMEPTFNNQEAFVGRYFPEINLFFNALNETVSLDSSLNNSISSINPLDNTPLTLSQTKRVTDIQNNVATIRYMQISADESSDITLNDTVDYSYNTVDRKILNVFSRRHIQIDSIKQVETITFSPQD